MYIGILAILLRACSFDREHTQYFSKELTPRTRRLSSGVPGQSNSNVRMKKKEIYTYDAPFTVFGLACSQRTSPEHSFRFAVGSFIEEYSNKVQVRARIVTMILRRASMLDRLLTMLPCVVSILRCADHSARR